MEKAREWRSANRLKVYTANARRRAARYGARFDENVDLRAVIERDEGRCYLCGRPVDEAKVSFDHVVPFARGGAHIAQNLRLAHVVCNQRKNVDTPDDFLRRSQKRPGRGGFNRRVLSPDDVRQIRSRAATGESQRALASAFSVSQPTICDIVNERLWRSLL